MGNKEIPTHDAPSTIEYSSQTIQLLFHYSTIHFPSNIVDYQDALWHSKGLVCTCVKVQVKVLNLYPHKVFIYYLITIPLVENYY